MTPTCGTFKNEVTDAFGFRQRFLFAMIGLIVICMACGSSPTEDEDKGQNRDSSKDVWRTPEAWRTYWWHFLLSTWYSRKPQPGMLIEAQKRWNIDFAQSYIIGDSESDIEAGQRVGCRGILTMDLMEAVELLWNFVPWRGLGGGHWGKLPI